MHIIFLGTASCYPTAQRSVSCTALRFEDGDVWIFDCGEGSQVQVQKSSIHPGKITKIFITHLHGDHLFGLPGIICTLGSQVNLAKSDFVLEIYGPLGLRRYLREVLNLSRSPLPFKYMVHELVPCEAQSNEMVKSWPITEEASEPLQPSELLGRRIEEDNGVWSLFEDEKGTVTAGPLIHRVPTFGFVIKEKDRPGKLVSKRLLDYGLRPGPLFGDLKRGKSITLPNGLVIHPNDVLGPPIKGRVVTILGDTCDSSGMTDIARDSDVLVHEATNEESMKEKAIENGHSTPSMAAAFAASINAKHLFLFHFSQRYKPEILDCLKSESDDSALKKEEENFLDVSILREEAVAALKSLNHNCNVTTAYDLLEYEIKRV